MGNQSVECGNGKYLPAISGCVVTNAVMPGDAATEVQSLLAHLVATFHKPEMCFVFATLAAPAAISHRISASKRCSQYAANPLTSYLVAASCKSISECRGGCNGMRYIHRNMATKVAVVTSGGNTKVTLVLPVPFSRAARNPNETNTHITCAR